jgi:hypothetical protein
MRSTLPFFSGNVSDYYINYLVELDILSRVDPKGNGVFLGTSPKNGGENENLPYSHTLYKYVQGLIKEADKQFYTEK